MKTLLLQCGDEVQITKEVVKAVARNTNNSKEVMTLLLD
jgi:glutamine synthetase